MRAKALWYHGFEWEQKLPTHCTMEGQSPELHHARRPRSPPRKARRSCTAPTPKHFTALLHQTRSTGAQGAHTHTQKLVPKAHTHTQKLVPKAHTQAAKPKVQPPREEPSEWSWHCNSPCLASFKRAPSSC